MKISEFIKKADLEVIVEGDLDREITGCYMGDLLSWVMGRAKAGDAWITIMTNLNMVAVAVLADVACVIIPEAAEIDPRTVEKAKQQDVCLLRSKLPAYETALEL